MTSLTTKLEEITKRLQQLTVWRPSERDPFFELDRWRADAHLAIEQVFNRKRQQIQQLTEKHEREFMRQLSRQRSLLNHIRQKLYSNKDMAIHNQTQNDISFFSDLQNIENDINARLGRAEILIELIPLDLDKTVTISLKTYLSATSSMYIKETSKINQPVKPKQRSADERSHAMNKWLQIKQEKETSILKELEYAKQQKRNYQENQLTRRKKSDEAYERWLSQKSEQMESMKKKPSVKGGAIKKEANET